MGRSNSRVRIGEGAGSKIITRNSNKCGGNADEEVGSTKSPRKYVCTGGEAVYLCCTTLDIFWRSIPTANLSLQTVGNSEYRGSQKKQIKVYTTTVCTSHVAGAGGDKNVLCTALGPR